ncbi:hypothetical protein HDU91_005470 [Kappamyces sp. JEL0680]|nr:hypothetical protein HDU91_005470 [Kappamyces sp. JEL0680]
MSTTEAPQINPEELARLLDNTLPFADDVSEGGSDDDVDSNGFVGTRSRAVSLLAEALLALIARLWVATLTVSVLMYFLRRIPLHPLVHQSGALISDREVEISVANDYQIYATPALFGKIFDGPVQGPALYVPHDACSSFHATFPRIELEDLDYMSPLDRINIVQQNASMSLRWIGVVERGGCPFDVKVYYMQQAGFSTTLVYNSRGEHRDATVRMSAHSMGSEVSTFSAFLSRGTGMALVSRISLAPQTTFLHLQLKSAEWISKKLLYNALVDMGVLFLLVVVTGSGFLVFGLVLNIFHNLFVHGELKLMETIHEASMIILAVSNQTPSQPKLKTVEFPRKTIMQTDLEQEWKCGGVKGQESCPICIEEFQIGDQVRELPCQHLFHDTWYC